MKHVMQLLTQFDISFKIHIIEIKMYMFKFILR